MKSGPLGRREFVCMTGALLAAPLASPLVAAAARLSRVAANDRIGLGLIGMGVQNRYHLGRFLNMSGVEVRAVCDVDTTRREHAHAKVIEKRGSDCGMYNDYRDLLAHEDIDAVVISTPDHWHAIQVIDACRAGKDIFCEKPLSFTLHESRVMIEAVRKHGRVLQTGSQQRSEYGHRFVTACEYVRNGRIGEVLNVNVGVGHAPMWCDLPEETMEPGLDWDRWLGPAPMRPYHSALSPRGVHGHYPTWRGYREYAGGYLADMGAHHFDIAQWGLRADETGPIEVMPPSEPHAMYGASLRYGNGAVVTHGGPSGTTFIGTQGMIHVDRGRLVSVPESILEKPLDESDERLPRHADHYVDWLDCLRTRAKPICDVEIGARSAAVCHLLNLAYWYRRPLKWNPQMWTFEGDHEANGWRDYDRRTGYKLPVA